jgi:hypothetical protein
LQQTLAFHLKAQVEECFKILWKEVHRRQSNTKEMIMKQANRTAWKILFDWTEIHCSMILLAQAKPLQIFLPYVYDMMTSEILFEKVLSGKVKWPSSTI